MNKKSEGLSLSVIVISAIALFVLIILILIFSGRIELFGKGLIECPPGTTKVVEGGENSDDVSAGLCYGKTLPVKVAQEKGDEGKSVTVYCCGPTPTPS